MLVTARWVGLPLADLGPDQLLVSGLPAFMVVCLTAAFWGWNRATSFPPTDSPKTNRAHWFGPRHPSSLILLAVVGLIVIGTTALYLRLRFDRVEARLVAELQVANNFQQRLLENWRRERLADAYALAHVPGIGTGLGQAVTTATPNPQATFLEDFRQAYAYRRAIYHDPTGQARFQTPREGRPPPAIDPALYTQLSVRRQIVLSDFSFHPQGEVRLDLFIPLTHPADDSFLGIIQLHIDPADDLYRLLQYRDRSYQTAESVLVRVEPGFAHVLSPLRFSPAPPGTVHIPLAVDSTRVSGHLKTPSDLALPLALDYRDQRVTAVGAPIEDSPWVIVTKVDRREAFQTFRQETIYTLLLVFITSLIAGQLLLAAWRRRENKLHEQQRLTRERLGLIMDSVNDAILIIDGESHIIEANARVRELYGYDPANLRGLPLARLQLEAPRAQPAPRPGNRTGLCHYPPPSGWPGTPRGSQRTTRHGGRLTLPAGRRA
jgi:PAS domain-containing protein